MYMLNIYISLSNNSCSRIVLTDSPLSFPWMEVRLLLLQSGFAHQTPVFVNKGVGIRHQIHPWSLYEEAFGFVAVHTSRCFLNGGPLTIVYQSSWSKGPEVRSLM